MRIAVAQINPTLGDFDSNQEKVLDYISRSKERHCQLVVFPESTLFGYHPFDLLERPELVKKQLKSLRNIEKSIPSGIGALIGVITLNPKKKGRPYFNSAALVQKGKKTKFFNKELLPTGDIFDEARFIEPGDMKKNFFSFAGKKFFLTICEDIWAWPSKDGRSIYLQNPIQKIRGKKVDCVLNMSASPYFPEKIKTREMLVKKTAKHFKAPMIYVNLVGAQDEVIYDGSSFAVSPNGKNLMNCISFAEDLNVLDLESLEGGRRVATESRAEEIRQALVLGIRDFCLKVGIQHIHLGLSGGIDSALVACLAVDAMGANRVTAIALPGPYSSDESFIQAQKLSAHLGVSFKKIDFNETYASIKSLVDKNFYLNEFGVVHENLQARLRGTILMAFANAKNSLLLATSNKSEYATGYSTLYGDMCGGLAPIGDLTKDQVYAISQLYNIDREVIPRAILDRAPTAELRPNQKDQDSLPAYAVLDESVRQIVENSGPKKSKTDAWLLETLMKNEFKRWQAPPILKVSKHSFGRGRRWPIAHKSHE